MPKTILHITIFLVCFNIFSQESLQKKLKPFEISLRMKGLSFVIIEDLFPRAHSIGVQCRFNEHFGIVLDVVNFRWLREQEIPYEPGDYTNYYEVNQKDNRYYLAGELRYYPFRIGKLGITMPYINIYSKWGKRKLRSQDEYQPGYEQPFNLNSSIFDLGASLGCEVGDRFGFDANIGFCYRWEKGSQDYFTDSQFILSHGNSLNHNRFLGNIRVSFYWNFMGKGLNDKKSDTK